MDGENDQDMGPKKWENWLKSNERLPNYVISIFISKILANA